MYAKSARIKSNSLSGAANSTLFVICFPSPLVRWSPGTARMFLPLMSFLGGGRVGRSYGTKLHGFWLPVHSNKKEPMNLCEMEQFREHGKTELTVLATDCRI